MHRGWPQLALLSILGSAALGWAGGCRSEPKRPAEPRAAAPVDPRRTPPPRDSAALGGAPAQRAADAAPPEWATVRSLRELRDLLDQAPQRSIIIHVRASSAVPCIALERKVLADEEVRQRLSGFLKIAADVSEGDRPAKDLMRKLRVKTLPAVLVYRQAKPLAQFLRDPQGKIRPWPAVLIESSVDVEGFLARMRRVLAR